MKNSKLYISVLFVGFLIFTACKSTKNSAHKEKDWQAVKSWVNGEEFEVEHQWLYPLRGNQINLIGNPNYIRMYKDSVDIFLPYFGVRQFGGGYNESGINYSGKPKDFSVTTDEATREIEITFEGNYKTEILNFKLNIYPSKTVRTYVQSSHRDNISYQGRIKELDSLAKE